MSPCVTPQTGAEDITHIANGESFWHIYLISSTASQQGTAETVTNPTMSEEMRTPAADNTSFTPKK